MKRKRRSEAEGRNVHMSLGKRAFWYLISIAFLFVAGCGGGSPTAPVAPKAKSVSKDAAKAGPPAAANEPEKKGEVEYAYNPTGKPDPFKPFIQLTPVKEASRKVPMTPLQRYEVSQLKLVAIMSTPEGNVARTKSSFRSPPSSKLSSGASQPPTPFPARSSANAPVGVPRSVTISRIRPLDSLSPGLP